MFDTGKFVKSYKYGEDSLFNSQLHCLSSAGICFPLADSWSSCISLWFSLHKPISNSDWACWVSSGRCCTGMDHAINAVQPQGIFAAHVDCTVFAPRYLQRTKHFRGDFWQVYVRILNGGQRSLKNQKVEPALYESWLQFWDATKGDCSHWAFFWSSLPPQTVLNAS